MPSKRGLQPEKKKFSPKGYSRQVSEREIHLIAWQWVSSNYPHVLIFHVPSGEYRDIATALKLKRMGVVPGVADFLMFTPNARVAIELKDQKGIQSKSQKLFQGRWEACGNHYKIARSFEEFKLIVGEYAYPWLKLSASTSQQP